MRFADFIAPFDAGEFRREVLGRRPLHVRRGTSAVPDVFDWERFNRALAIAPYWTEDSLKVYYRNRAAPRENYCDTADLRPGQPAPANPARVQALLGLGASLIANQVHRVSPGVAAVTDMLEREFAARAFANVYCSFQGVQAFQTHFDLHDVFALQVEGEKTWRIYESRADTPVQPLPPGEEIEKWLQSSRGALLFEAKMAPGDVLYLPRGQYHDALTGAQASLHVTFGLQPATGLSLFPLLEKLLARESAFREYLPDARDGDALGRRLAALADRVRAVMASPAFAADVRGMQAELARPSAAYGLPERPATAWYSVAKPAQLQRRDAGYVVVYDGGELPAGEHHATIEWVLKQKLFSVADAQARRPSADAAGLRRDLERLERAGILAATEMR